MVASRLGSGGGEVVFQVTGTATSPATVASLGTAGRQMLVWSGTQTSKQRVSELSLLPARWCLDIAGRYVRLLHGLPWQSNSSYVPLGDRGTHRGIRTGRNAARSEHLGVVGGSGVRDAPPDRLDISGVVP